MAARRLVIVMLVLLGLSTLVAALVPTPNPDREKTSATNGASGKNAPDPDRAGNPDPAGTPGLVSARIDISQAAGKPPAVVRVKPGNRLILAVGGSVGADISIPGFGLTETMTPTAPARFDLIVDRAGRFPVRVFGSDRAAGTIVSKN